MQKQFVDVDIPQPSIWSRTTESTAAFAPETSSLYNGTWSIHSMTVVTTDTEVTCGPEVIGAAEVVAAKKANVTITISKIWWSLEYRSIFDVLEGGRLGTGRLVGGMSLLAVELSGGNRRKLWEAAVCEVDSEVEGGGEVGSGVRSSISGGKVGSKTAS